MKTGNITGVKFCLRPRLSWQLPPRTAIVAATFSAGAQHAMPWPGRCLLHSARYFFTDF
jgi:hypothetical protein